MKIQRIIGVLKQEYFITIHSLEIGMDLLVFPLINIVVFGFLSLYLSGDEHGVAGQFVLLGMLLWQIIWIVEYSVCLGSLWNIWSRNLSNMFIAPLLVKEYILAHGLSGIIKALLMLLISGVMSVYIFDFNVLSIGIGTLALVFINFTLFAFSMGIAILGLIFRFGTRIQAFAWGIVSIFQPLSAAFFPLEILPVPLQYVASLFPSTFAFEAARYSLVYHQIPWDLFTIAIAENIFYLVVSVLFFRHMFNKSRDAGQFARNEA